MTNQHGELELHFADFGPIQLRIPLTGDPDYDTEMIRSALAAMGSGLGINGDVLATRVQEMWDVGVSQGRQAAPQRSAPAQPAQRQDGGQQDQPRVIDLIMDAGPCGGGACDVCGGQSYIDPRKSAKGNDMPHKCPNRKCMDERYKEDGTKLTSYHMTHWPNDCSGGQQAEEPQEERRQPWDGASGQPVVQGSGPPDADPPFPEEAPRF